MPPLGSRHADHVVAESAYNARTSGKPMAPVGACNKYLHDYLQWPTAKPADRISTLSSSCNGMDSPTRRTQSILYRPLDPLLPGNGENP